MLCYVYVREGENDKIIRSNLFIFSILSVSNCLSFVLFKLISQARWTIYPKSIPQKTAALNSAFTLHQVLCTRCFPITLARTYHDPLQTCYNSTLRSYLKSIPYEENFSVLLRCNLILLFLLTHSLCIHSLTISGCCCCCLYSRESKDDLLVQVYLADLPSGQKTCVPLQQSTGVQYMITDLDVEQ